MFEMRMPRLSDSMQEGVVVQWLVVDGAEVRRGDEVVEIETDKATMAFEADADGPLKIVANGGTTVPVGEVIARIGVGEVNGTARKSSASPLARRHAAALGVDLASVTGSGPAGRILKADVVAAVAGREAGGAVPAAEPRPALGPRQAPAPPPAATSQPVPRAAAPSDAAPPASDGDATKGTARSQDLSRVQQVVARRMAEAKATVPDFALRVDVDMEAVVTLRHELKGTMHDDAVVPTFNDFVVKACAVALARHPRANGSYRDGRFELFERVNVGVAVADADVLVVPVVPDADRKTLGRIAGETRRLAERVRDGAITSPELAGGTFTVSNLGMFGVTDFTAVINQPQAAILAVGAIEPRVVAVGDDAAIRRRMTLQLTCDHRILYGADAARFLAEVRDALERPLGRILVPG